MKIFDLRFNPNDFASFLFKDLDENDKWEFPLFAGERYGKAYPVPAGVRDHEGDPPYPEALPDFTGIGLGPIPTFSEHAIQILGPMLSENGEFAAIALDEPVRYFGFNPTTIVDILDESRSDIVRFSSGRVMKVNKHVLLDSVTSLPPIFKIPQTRRNTTYVNEAFVTKVRDTGLTGFRFDLLFER
ncbi:MAG: hypothetical protein QM772_05760 [Ottowia sp.]|uniref:hypothetical protein n=1 Tax=Ottowia sp. TaxID=1898956 RepID=UPI0039E69A71